MPRPYGNKHSRTALQTACKHQTYILVVGCLSSPQYQTIADNPGSASKRLAPVSTRISSPTTPWQRGTDLHGFRVEKVEKLGPGRFQALSRLGLLRFVAFYVTLLSEWLLRRLWFGLRAGFELRQKPPRAMVHTPSGISVRG